MTNEITPAHCNHCGWLTNHYVLGEDRSGFEHEDQTWDAIYEMLKCCGCGTITMRNVVKGYGDEPLVIYYPPAMARRAPEWVIGTSEIKIPPPIRDLMREVYSAVQNGSLRLAAMGIRAVLENVMIEKVGDLGSFKAHVDAFQKSHYLSVRQASTLQTILEAGHASTHRGWRPARKDIETLLDICEGIIETVYIHEQRAQELDKVVPRRQRPTKPNQ